MKLSASAMESEGEPREKPHRALDRYTLDPDRRRPARLFVALVAMLGGVMLLALGIPRLLAAIELLDARSIAERAVVNDTTVANPQIESAALALQHALQWQDDADLMALLAAVRLAQAGRAADDAALAAERLSQAAEIARRAIRQSPAHPTAWTILALALQARDPRDPLFATALQRAIAVAPFDPRYLVQRIEMACRYWHLLDEPARQLALAEIRALADRDLRTLVALAKRSYGLPAVRDALANDPALLEKFDAAYIAPPP
ncbi:hypothetical protein [Reyranella sp. CPCC 100927]|uniref:hypothetical protein n=1 Tax=Reyranella sp. CPCC 100927 TaxID=2599616 RepID=UPI0011B44C44|nr:hypothetical protein [Reyranella sp. CPCC 100927]TWT14982.1 hypothetical protein FQU96_01025 [Reyranella sp. CPCC 100927]